MKDLRDTRLIVVDMDDTLLRSDKTISSDTVEVLQRAIDRGILVVPSSGRSYDGLPEELGKFRGIRYAINLNGGVVTQAQPRQILYRKALSLEEARVVFDRLAVFHSPRTVFTDDITLMEERDKAHVEEFTFPHIVPYYYKTRTFIPDMLEYLAQNTCRPIKISAMIHRDGSNQDEVRAQIGNYPEFSAVASPDGLEVTAKGVTKGEGLRQLCAITGIPIAQTVAFGDSDNDTSMMEAAGTAVAMENAIPALREMADYVTRSNDADGVAWFVENYIL